MRRGSLTTSPGEKLGKGSFQGWREKHTVGKTEFTSQSKEILLLLQLHLIKKSCGSSRQSYELFFARQQRSQCHRKILDTKMVCLFRKIAARLVLVVVEKQNSVSCGESETAFVLH